MGRERQEIRDLLTAGEMKEDFHELLTKASSDTLSHGKDSRDTGAYNSHNPTMSKTTLEVSTSTEKSSHQLLIYSLFPNESGVGGPHYLLCTETPQNYV